MWKTGDSHLFLTTMLVTKVVLQVNLCLPEQAMKLTCKSKCRINIQKVTLSYSKKQITTTTKPTLKVKRYLKVLDIYASLWSVKRVPWTWVFLSLVICQAEHRDRYCCNSVKLSRDTTQFAVSSSVPENFSCVGGWGLGNLTMCDIGNSFYNLILIFSSNSCK